MCNTTVFGRMMGVPRRVVPPGRPSTSFRQSGHERGRICVLRRGRCARTSCPPGRLGYRSRHRPRMSIPPHKEQHDDRDPDEEDDCQEGPRRTQAEGDGQAAADRPAPDDRPRQARRRSDERSAERRRRGRTGGEHRRPRRHPAAGGSARDEAGPEGPGEGRWWPSDRPLSRRRRRASAAGAPEAGGRPSPAEGRRRAVRDPSGK